MSNAEIIEEMSQFYDIKQKVVENGNTVYYIVYRDITIGIDMRYADGDFYNDYHAISKGNTDTFILLIDKLYEIFEFTHDCVSAHNIVTTIYIGSVKLRFYFGDLVSVGIFNDDVDYVIEHLKKTCPECIKSSDIKIALKD